MKQPKYVAKNCNRKIVQKKLQIVRASFFKTCKVIKLETAIEVESECIRECVACY